MRAIGIMEVPRKAISLALLGISIGPLVGQSFLETKGWIGLT